MTDVLSRSPADEASPAPGGRRPAVGRRRRALVAGAVVASAAIVALTAAVVASPGARHDEGRTAAKAPADDKGFSLLMNGHRHVMGPDKPLDAATRKRLDAQLAVTRQLAEKYPDVAAAEAAGFHRYGAFTPGLGTHYVDPDHTSGVTGAMDRDELLHPVLIFDGSEPDSPLAGFMYISFTADASVPQPEGFAGPNDHWHYHDSVCLRTRADGAIDAPFGADADVTPAMCTTVGGNWMGLTNYMVHVWTAPGYANRYGVFHEQNPHLDCPDGTYYQIPWREMGDRITTCRSG
jgi:hypothetical protein